MPSNPPSFQVPFFGGTSGAPTAGISQTVRGSMPLPFLAAAAPSIVSGIAGLFGASSASKNAAKDRAEQRRQYDATMAQNALQFNQSAAAQAARDRYTQLSGDREWGSGQDDKRRRILDQGAVNPQRQALIAMLMQRLGGLRTPAGIGG